MRDLVRAHPVGSLVATAILIEVALVPVFLLTGADAALEQALDRTGRAFNTDLVTATGLVLDAPWVWWSVLLALLQVASPDIALVWIAKVAAAPQWLRDVRRRLRFWHPALGRSGGGRVWATTLVVFVSMNVASGVLHDLRFGDDEFTWSPPSTFGAFVVALLVATFLDAGAVFEENAWRGFALPILEVRHGPLLGSIVLGGWWTLWHVPVKFGLFVDHGLVGGTLLFAVLGLKFVALSVVMTHFFNRAGESTILAIAMHGLSNDSIRLGGLVEPSSLASEVWAELDLAIPLLLVAAWLTWRTRGRLSHDRVRDLDRVVGT